MKKPIPESALTTWDWWKRVHGASVQQRKKRKKLYRNIRISIRFADDTAFRMSCAYLGERQPDKVVKRLMECYTRAVYAASLEAEGAEGGYDAEMEAICQYFLSWPSEKNAELQMRAGEVVRQRKLMLKDDYRSAHKELEKRKHQARYAEKKRQKKIVVHPEQAKK